MKTNNKVYCTLLTIVVEKLTENRTIELLMPFLVQQGYAIESFCLGQTRGYDIVAVKNNRKLFVEVKGAKAKYHSAQGYITQMRHYLKHGDWCSDFYGPYEDKRVKWQTIVPKG